MGKGGGSFVDEQYYLRANTPIYTLFSEARFGIKKQVKQMLLRISAPNFIQTLPLIDFGYET